ncbi:MAG: ribonuclease Z [Bacteroidota bacterium]
MKFSLTILGSSSAVPTASRNTTAHVLNAHERFYLIDCGEGTQSQIRKYRIRLGSIHQIFISHLHSDHILGLFGLLSTLSLLGRKSELVLYGPQKLEGIVTGHFKLMPDTLMYPLKFIILPDTGPEMIHEDKALSVYSFPVKHRIPAWGFIFREKTDSCTDPCVEGRTYVYCTDTIFNADFSEWFRDCDLMYHEATYSHAHLNRAVSTAHSTALQAGEMARLSNARQLLIGHFSARYKDISLLLNEAQSVFPNTLAAMDGMTVEIPSRKTEK